MVRKCRKGTVEAKDGIGVSSTYMQLRSRRIVYVRSENSSSVADDDGVSSTNLSCCYSTTTTKSRNVVVNEFIDLEEDIDGDTETSTYRRTKRKLFENLGDRESSKKSMENHSLEIAESPMKESSDCCCSGRRRTSSTTEQPTETEIEEFFVEAEKQLQDKFKKKYNFDFEKEKPLKGRYEWVKLE